MAIPLEKAFTSTNRKLDELFRVYQETETQNDNQSEACILFHASGLSSPEGRN